MKFFSVIFLFMLAAVAVKGQRFCDCEGVPRNYVCAANGVTYDNNCTLECDFDVFNYNGLCEDGININGKKN